MPEDNFSHLNSDVLYNNIACNLLDLNDLASASEYLERGLKLHPAYYSLHFNKSVLLRKQEKFELAIKAADESIRLNPNYVPAYIVRGVSHNFSGNFDKAVLDFEKSLHLEFSENYHVRNLYKVIDNMYELHKASNQKLILQLLDQGFYLCLTSEWKNGLTGPRCMIKPAISSNTRVILYPLSNLHIGKNARRTLKNNHKYRLIETEDVIPYFDITIKYYEEHKNKNSDPSFLIELREAFLAINKNKADGSPRAIAVGLYNDEEEKLLAVDLGIKISKRGVYSSYSGCTLDRGSNNRNSHGTCQLISHTLKLQEEKAGYRILDYGCSDNHWNKYKFALGLKKQNNYLKLFQEGSNEERS